MQIKSIVPQGPSHHLNKGSILTIEVLNIKYLILNILFYLYDPNILFAVN